MRTPDLTVEQARAALRYEPDTGKMFWRATGREAFTSDSGKGYRQGSLRGRKYLAHRIIWFLQTGSWPLGCVDHANGKRNDNRWANLADVTNAENMKNRARLRSNTSGAVGVSWHKASGKWRATLRLGRNLHHLGLFKTKDEAIAARVRASKEHGFSLRHGTSVDDLC